MSFEQIARSLGISVRTVTSDFSSAVKKLKSQDSFLSLLELVSMAHANNNDPLQAGSLECQRGFVAQYGEGNNSAK